MAVWTLLCLHCVLLADSSLLCYAIQNYFWLTQLDCEFSVAVRIILVLSSDCKNYYLLVYIRNIAYLFITTATDDDVSYVLLDTRAPASQRPAAQPYQQAQQPRQQHQQYAEPHYATPRPHQAADQREPHYDRQQPVHRQYEMAQQGGHIDSRPRAQQQQQHPAQGRHPYEQQQQPFYPQQQPHYQQQQPVYSAQPRFQYEPQHAAYQQRLPSAIEPSYPEPYLARDGRVVGSRSKSASDLNHPEAISAWPMQPSVQYDRGCELPLAAQEPLSSWKSYEGPGQHGLASHVDMREPARVDRQHRETRTDGRHVSPDPRQYGDQWAAPGVRGGTLNRQVPYWPESDRRSQPQLSATKQQGPATYSSHPELSTARQFVEPAHDMAPFTSNDLLRRAQPGGQGVTSPTPFTQPVPPPSAAAGHGSLERRSVPVGGHLRAIDPKHMQQMDPVVAPEHSRPSTYYEQPSQGPVAELTYVKPASRSQSLPRASQPPAGAWERARKEEELRHVELEQKRRREDEIHHLESRLPDQLSPAEIDRLRRLKLNAEFDRRASELERTGDQLADTNTDMTPAVSDFLNSNIRLLFVFV